MTDKAALVLKGYTELGYSEREEVRKKIDEFETPLQKSVVLEEVRTKIGKVVLGPTGGACPCCGR